MRPRRTHISETVYRLEGGNEDNDLYVHRYPADGNTGPAIGSIWELTADERQQIVDGQNVELIVWGTGHPPVTLRVSDVPLGKAPGVPLEPDE